MKPRVPHTLLLVFLAATCTTVSAQTTAVGGPSAEPGDAALSYYDRAMALHRAGQYAEAVPDFERAISLNPNFLEAHNNLGDAYYRLGE